MSSEPTKESVIAMTKGLYRGAIVAADCVEDVRKNLLDKVINRTPRAESLYQMVLRAEWWMGSLKKLTDSTDFQAIVSCDRSLLEIAVNLILLHCDETNESDERMRLWEQSAFLKSAIALQFYYASAGRAVPDEYQEQVDFVANKKEWIEERRKELWKREKHPERWTCNNLEDDVKEADRVFGDEIEREFGTSLTEFYQTEYRRMNWLVHGYALAGMRTSRTKLFDCALGFKSCGDLALLGTKAILIDFGFMNHFATKWEAVRQQRLKVYAHAVGLVSNQE